MSLEEADYRLEGTKKGDFWLLAAANPLALRSTPSKDDFYFTGAKLLVEAISAKPFNARITLKAKDAKGTVDIAGSPYFPVSKESSGAQIPFTSVYLNPKYPRYSFELSGGAAADVKPSLELTFAVGRSKSHTEGVFSAKDRGVSNKDFAANTKVLKPNGKNDAMIAMNANIFGANLNAVTLVAETKSGRREWNTKPGNFFPGIAVVDETGAVRNNTDGSIHYPFQKFSSTLYLYFDKGALDNLGKLTLSINVDDHEIVVPF
jgi:hypothetical protein